MLAYLLFCRGFFIDFSQILCYNTHILASRLMQIVVIRRKTDIFSLPFLQTAYKARPQAQQAKTTGSEDPDS